MVPRGYRLQWGSRYRREFPMTAFWLIVGFVVLAVFVHPGYLSYAVLIAFGKVILVALAALQPPERDPRVCPRCHSTSTVCTVLGRSLSAFNPWSVMSFGRNVYRYQCRDCNKQWKHRSREPGYR